MVGNKWLEAKKGIYATCHICDKRLIPYCGDYNTNHWRHEHNTNRECDSFYEPITKWHLNWQNEFPKNWREVVINRSNKLHRADIHTPKDLTIEFQNSPISNDEIKKREAFYGKLIWVVNAISFKKNMQLTCIETEKLKNLENELKLKTKENLKTKNLEIELYNYNIRNDNLKVNNARILMKESKLEITQIQRDLKNVKLYLEEKYTIGCLENNILDEPEFKWFLQKESPQFYNRLNVILDELKDKCIEKHFLTQKINTSNTSPPKVILLDNEITSYKNKIEALFLKISEEFTKFLNHKLKCKEKEYRITKNKLEHLEKELRTKDKSNEFHTNLNIKQTQNENKIRNWHKTQANEIIQKYKDTFNLNWKYKKKSWSTANKPIFFDMGDEYVYRWISEKRLKRYTKNQFLKHYLNHAKT